MSSLLASALGLAGDARPFPWQRGLLDRFMEGRIPRALDIPTGLGKTATMAAWLVARCSGARLPRRLVYVVDRRAVVDQATREAERLRDWLDSRPDLKEAAGLEADQSLPISTLRGRFVDNREWLEDPSRPAIIVGTVDMVGSRLLFQGYGVSRKMRPYHAGLLGCDALLVLDEAHLVPSFEALVEAVACRTGRLAGESKDDGLVLPGLTVVSLSATGRAVGGEAFRLDEDEADPDRQDEEVRRRILARKEVTLHDIEGDELGEVLAERAWDLSNGGRDRTRIVVYCNSRGVAGDVAAALEDRIHTDVGDSDETKAEVALLVGARRVRERSLVASELVRLGFDGRHTADQDERAGACFLVATSAGEVGVDLDAHHMVSDLVEWDRMGQRLGRVNRRGRGEAVVHVYVEPVPATAKPGEAAAQRARRELLEGLRPLAGGGLDASPDALAARTGELEGTELLRAATTAVPFRPPLDAATVEGWSATSLEAHTGRPPVHPWLRGWVDEPPQGRIAFRSRLPRGDVERDDYARYFEAAPIHTSETLETEAWRLAEWLFARVKRVTRAHERRQKGDSRTALPRTSDPWAFLLDTSGTLVGTWSLDQLAEVAGQAKKRRDRWQRGLYGQTIVIDAAFGGLIRGLLDPAVDEVPDTADEDDGEWLPKTPSGDPVVPFRTSLTSSRDPVADGNWHEGLRIAAAHDDDGEEAAWLVVQHWRHQGAREEDRSAAPLQELEQHQEEAVVFVEGIADRLNLPEPIRFPLITSARGHDEGKRASKWQRAFSAPSGGPFAKTPGPVRSQLLEGYRHEFGSLGRLDENVELRHSAEERKDLVRHLVAAHHGFARPLLRADGCEDGPPSVLRNRSREAALRFYRLQERFGPWGLAWLESLLRAADQQASRQNVVDRGSDAGGLNG